MADARPKRVPAAMLTVRPSARRSLVIALLLVAAFFYGYNQLQDPGPAGISRAPLTQTWIAEDDKQTQSRIYHNIFAFGDSLTWTNFNTEFDMPTRDKPFGSDYPGYTTAGGPNWLGFLWHDYLPTTLLFNLAQGGAQTSSGEFGDAKDGERDLSTQVDTFLRKLHEPHGLPDWEPEHTLFPVWLGTNDIYGAYLRKRDASIFDEVLRRFFAQVDRLVEAGADEFLLLTPEPLHLVRLHSFGNPLDRKLQSMVYAWNKKLQLHIRAWHARTGKRVHVIDVTTMVEQALVAGVAKPCSSLEDELPHEECIWEDKFHIGTKVHRMIAEAAKTMLSL